jgi:hypothetical protein
VNLTSDRLDAPGTSSAVSRSEIEGASASMRLREGIVRFWLLLYEETVEVVLVYEDV